MATVCRSDGPANAATTLILAHGAGAPMDSPFLEHFARSLAERGVRVVRFEFPYMDVRRQGRRPPPDREPVLLATWREVVAAQIGTRPAIGGKSLGGRMASRVADEVGARALVCLGYPFHPPGKPERLRVGHLERLETPTLIVQGTRDPFGGRDEVGRYPLPATIRFHWIEDGDHSFKPRARSGRTEGQNLEDAVEAVASFLAALP